jgi:uncharacterized protein YoxC
MPDDTSSREPGLHIPFAILALAIAVLLLSQIGASNKSTEIMRWQRETLEKQIASMQALDKEFADAYEKNGPLVEQSIQLQKQLESVANDLLDLARDDADAKQIIEKWKIQRSAAPAAAEEKKDEKKTP